MKNLKFSIVATCLLAFSLLFLGTQNALGQTTSNIQQPTSVNTDGAAPAASAMLDVQSTTKGMLAPRMTTAQRTAIATPAPGLLVYDTDTGSFWYYESNTWYELVAATVPSEGGTNPMDIPIPDGDPTGITSTITLTDPDTVSTDTRFQVCLDITHTFTGDLDISLVAPDGTSIDLSSDNGGSGDNYTGTCFTTEAANPIVGNNAPFTGNWQPEGSFTDFVGKTIAGDWKLKVVDDDPFVDAGQLNFWSLQLSRPPAASATLLADADGDTRITVEDLSDEDFIRFDVKGSEAMVIDSTGRVGIGTTTPVQLLTISDASEPVLRFERTSGANFDYEAYTTSGGKLIFRGGADGTGAALTDFVTFNQLGRVGIGTDQPTAKLDVNGSIHLNLGTNTLLYNGANASGTPGDDAFRMKYESSFFGTDFDALVFEKTDVNGDDPDGGIAFVNTGQDNLSETAMVIRGDGKVGIGTSGPDFRLDLRGNNVNDGPVLQMTNSDKTNFIRLFSGRAGDPNPFVNWQSGTDLCFTSTNINFSGLVEHMRIQSDGKVGISTAAPSADLHIKQSSETSGSAGGLRLERPSSTDNWKIFVFNDNDLSFGYNGLLKAYIKDTDGTYNSFSDRRLKKNIEPLPSVLSQLLQLNPVRYHFKDVEETTPKSFGFIAQEVQPLFPDVVGEKNGYLSMDYGALGIIAIQAIQEQQAIIEKQQSEIESLQSQLSEMDELKARMAKLEAALSGSPQSTVSGED